MLIAALLIATCHQTQAIPSDGLDDRATLQAELDAHACVELGPGIYDVSNDPLPGVTHMASLTLRDGQRLVGQGPSTILRFVGDGLKGDWNGLHVAGSGVTIEHMHIAFAGSNTEEQTHAIQVGRYTLGPIRGTIIRDVSFTWQRPTVDDQMGDCIRVLGEPGQEVRDTLIERVTFGTCARTGLGVQRQAFGGIVRDSVFVDNGTDVDFELTGGVHAIGGGWIFERNEHQTGPSNQGGNAFHLQSVDALLTGVTIRSSRLLGRGIWAHNTVDIRIEDNLIRHEVQMPSATLHFQKNSDRIVVVNNTVERLASAGVGEVIRTVHHGTGYVGEIRVERNRLRQETAANGVYLQTAMDATVINNRIERTGAVASVFAVDISGIVARSLRTSIANNVIVGGWLGAMRAVGGYAGLGAVLYTGNVTSGPAYGMTCVAGLAGVNAIASAGNLGPEPFSCTLTPTN